MEDKAKRSIRKRLLSYFHAHRRDMISVAIFVPSVLTIGIYLGIQMDRHFVVKDGIKNGIYWSCNHFWEGPLAGGGKRCEARLIHGTNLRYQTGWKNPDIGSLARDIPVNDSHKLTHVALLTDKIFAKTDDGAYYIIAFELFDNGGHTQKVSGPMDESLFVEQAPDTTLNWMPVHTP
ncbi:hypothetical protein ACQKH5_15255 [Hyphomonas sp. NPDC076900]|uniref:hypothetical protein n=1 Tax=unclassified Hyphomonas TaxID=2630699 RepID=UPI000DEDB2EC|nr:hypothetical protein [Hyphomonas sp. CACIAM 19H1]AXE63400.1 hypothetical protein BBF93_03585 [Hyphomonas sp. CACIAM 19H1]